MLRRAARHRAFGYNPGVRRRIYIAGPDVFLPNWPAVAERKRDICEQFGFEAVFPADDPATDERTAEAARRLSEANERLIESCDALIANMTPFRGPSMDVGTAYEMGYMRALGRPVLGYSNVADSLLERVVRVHGGEQVGDRWVDTDGSTIEDFGLAENLMLAGAVLASGAEVVRLAAAPDRGLADLTAFTLCVENARRVFALAHLGASGL